MLHALWAAGFFDATLPFATALPGFYDGLSGITITPGLPPVFWIDDAECEMGDVCPAEIQIGSFMLDMDNGLGARTQLMLGAVLAVTLDVPDTGTGQISFTDMSITTLYVSPFAPALVDTTTREGLEGLLEPILEDTLRAALGTAMPGLPLPQFALPAEIAGVSLEDLDLPTDIAFTVADPEIANQQACPAERRI